ncbi:MAG TPA: serine--tRNA ligase [Dehalococcoidia bacterium]|nr:serine--tRNA ligase [Dehalococcoidia bacterium]
MLSLQFIRENIDLVRESLAKRFDEAPLDDLLCLDDERRRLLHEVEALRARRNTVSKELARMLERPAELLREMREVGGRIKELDERVSQIDGQLRDLLLTIPNVVHPSVPVARDDSGNVTVRAWGDAATPPHSLPHWDIGERLRLVDFQRGVKISGSRFYVLTGLGARLERALINWMLDLHTQQHGYREVATPYLVTRESMTGTGQLPKFEEDLYHCEADDLFLIPTAEVPVTNLHRDEILEPGSLPLCYVCYTACFRREAGAAGKDTRGVIRVHQFDKVELVKFVEPQASYDELEKLVANAEEVLKQMGIPYRVSLMSSGETGFAATKKYDMEAWSPGQGRYIEVSSCSNFEAFQARRANIRYRPAPGGRVDYPHTLNGSGLAVGRTFALVLENYYQPDGTVAVPEVLRPYMGGLDLIR